MLPKVVTRQSNLGYIEQIKATWHKFSKIQMEEGKGTEGSLKISNNQFVQLYL
jgi:hypothetical protein